MGKPPTRTNLDEYKLDEELRADSEIKRAVTVEFREALLVALKNQERLIEAQLRESELLANSLAALAVYRAQHKEHVCAAIGRLEAGVSPSGQYQWADGWELAKEGKVRT